MLKSYTKPISSAIRIFAALSAASSGVNAYASDACGTRATLASSMAVTKYSARESLRQKPVSGPVSDVWRLMAYLSADGYKNLGDTTEQIQHTARLIADSTASSDWRIEMLMYYEFFKAACEAKLNVLDIPLIDGAELGSCFGQDVPACVRAHVSKIRNASQTK